MKKHLLVLVFSLFSVAITAQDTATIFVALWDSPAGQDLYWGMRYGIKTHFKLDADWKLIEENQPSKIIQEELVFVNEDLNLVVRAKAYGASYIKRAITDFINYSYQANADELVVYVGHDGLMDFSIDVEPQTHLCNVMVFSCVSQTYFSPYVDMILSTFTFMAPEAYGVMTAIESWKKGFDEVTIRKETARSYAHYQKISVGAAERTFLE